ncbi:MAG: hypothetical protein ACK415_08825, partial [Thermodesulfovibrionales bacterium]
MEIPIMISPDITGNPAPIDKDVMSGTDEKAGSVPFLSSLLSMISSLNPINTLGVQQDEIVSPSSGTFQPLPDLIDSIISRAPVQGETTLSKEPNSLSLNSYSSVNEKLLDKSEASTDIQNPISMIKKETVEFSSLNPARGGMQPYHFEEKESPHPLSGTGFLPNEFPVRYAKVANPSPLHQTTPSSMRTTVLMGKDLATLPFKDTTVSRQGVKGLNLDDKTVLSLDEGRESVIFEETNRDLTGFHVIKKNGEPELYYSLKTFKDGFEGEFKITMAEVSTDQRDRDGFHQQKDVPSSLVLRQIDLPSNIVSADDTKPLQDKQSLKFPKAIIAHLDTEHSHAPDLSTIKVTVQHDRLGELDIKLILNKGIINGQIKTPEVTTADLIVRNMPEIINSLIKDGLN